MSLTPYGESPDESRMTAAVRARLEMVQQRIADVEQAEADGEQTGSGDTEANAKTES